MKGDNGIIMVVLAAAVVIGASAFVAFESDSNQNSSADKLTEGYWYEVGYYCMGDDGTYKAIDEKALGSDTEKLEFGINVTQVSEGTFSCKYMGYLLAGTCSDDGIVSAYGYVMNSVHVWMYGKISNGVMAMSILERGESNTAIYAVYSQDESTVPSNPTFVDISGNWSMTSGTSLLSEGTTVGSLSGSNLIVTKQKGMVFCGTMEQEIDGSVTTVDICGVLSSVTNGGARIGFVSDSQGENWTLMAKSGLLDLTTATIGETDDTSYVCAMERVYDRGSASSDNSTSSVQLKGTTWSLLTADYTNRNSVSYQQYGELTISFTEQKGNLLTGVMNNNGLDLPMAAYIFGDSPTSLGILTCDAYGIFGDSYGLAKITDDGNLEFTASQGYGYSAVDLVFSQKEYTFDDIDMEKHWICVNSYGRTLARTIHESLYSTSDNNDLLFDLDIKTASNGLFQGTFKDTYVSGTYEGNSLTFNANLGDGSSVLFFGTLKTDSVMFSEEVYIMENGAVEAWVSVYSLTDIHGVVPQYSEDRIGSWNWESPDGYSFVKNTDGSVVNLLGNKMVIIKYGCLLFGNMEQEVNGEVASKRIVGVYLNGYSGSEDRMVIVDNTGLIYYGNKVGDTLLLSTTVFSDADEDANRVSVDRAYAFDANPTIPEFDSYLDQKWTSTSSTFMKADGTTGDYGAFTISVTSQYNNLVSGTVTVSGTSYDMVGFISAVDGAMYISFNDFTIFQGEKLVLNEDGSATLYGHTDANGNPFAYIVKLEKSV